MRILSRRRARGGVVGVAMALLLIGSGDGVGAPARAAPRGSGVSWPAGYVKPLGIKSSKVARLARGQRLVTFVVSGKRDPVWKGWLAGFRRAGWTVISEHGWHGHLRSASVKKGALRAYLHLARVRKAVHGMLRTVVAPRRAVRLRGPCVKIPDRRFHIYVHPNAGAPIRRHYGHGRARYHRPKSLYYGYRTRFEYDLDGDGVLDALVPVSRRAYCPKSVKREVYIVRGRCGHRVGTLGGGWIDARLHRVDPVARGLKEIRISYQHVGGPPRGYRRRRRGGPLRHLWRVKQTYSFRRGRYRKIKEKKTGGRCHHCGFSTCTGPIDVRTCPPKAPDRLSQAAQKPVFDRATRAVRACVARRKVKPPKIVWVGIKVPGRTGRVASAQVLYNSARQAAVRRCALSVFRKLRFPRFCGKPLRVHYPVKFPRP